MTDRTGSPLCQCPKGMHAHVSYRESPVTHICSSLSSGSRFSYATGKETSKWQNSVTFGKVTSTQENPLKNYDKASKDIFQVEAWNITSHSGIRAQTKKGLSFKFYNTGQRLEKTGWLKALTKRKLTVIPHGFQSTEKDQSWQFHNCSINIPAEACGREGKIRGKEGRKVQAREEVEQEDPIPLASES